MREITKEDFLKMQNWSLENATILDENLLDFIRSSNANSIEEQSNNIANYLYSNYEEIVLDTKSEKVLGYVNNHYNELYDVKDRKAHLDF